MGDKKYNQRNDQWLNREDDANHTKKTVVGIEELWEGIERGKARNGSYLLDMGGRQRGGEILGNEKKGEMKGEKLRWKV